MAITQDFKKIVDDDISMCEYELKNGNKNSNYDFQKTLKSKYESIIDGFTQNLYTLFYDTTGVDARKNIEIMKQKLILFKSMGYENITPNGDSNITVNNTNQIITNINISFSEVRGKIENMSALQDSEINEILEKVNELEDIIKSSERKTKKWEKAKGIIKWVADKGVDVGITLLPLILKIGQ